MNVNQIRPAWAEVDLGLLKQNFRNIKRAAGSPVMAIVKANAYGHGAVECSKALIDAGAEALGVAVGLEALELRAGGIGAPILVLGYTPPEQAQALVEQQVDMTVYTTDHLQYVAEAASRAGKRARVHIKVETGMGRLGTAPGPALDALLDALTELSQIQLVGIFTHFASSEEDHEYTRHQFENYKRALRALENRGLEGVLRHSANSGAVMDFPETSLDIVRPGILLYGYYPSQSVARRADVKPVLSLKARIAHLRLAGEGETLGYGRTHKVTSPTLVATLPIGYADGYDRRFSNRGHVLVRGKAARVLGRVCMDQMMVDVTQVEGVSVGDEVVLIGRQGDMSCSAEDLAASIDTIPNELLAQIGRRVPRVYTEAESAYAIHPLSTERIDANISSTR